MQRFTVALVLMVGCVGSEDPVERDAELRQVLTRALDPPVAVETDRDVGVSIDTIAASATQDSDEAYSPTVADCVMRHYESNGVIVAVYELCDGSHRRLFVYHAADGGALLWRVYGDLDDDGLVDAWFDPEGGGLLIEDRNYDDAVDASSESFERLGADYAIEGFEAGWIPPAYLDERILEDTDFDGYYDRETITGGLDPDGNQTFWQKP